jgi:hypothetical protein
MILYTLFKISFKNANFFISGKKFSAVCEADNPGKNMPHFCCKFLFCLAVPHPQPLTQWGEGGLIGPPQ